MLSKTEQDATNARAALLNKFDHLEKVVGTGPYFNGSSFSLVDAAYAPSFQRIDYLNALWPGAWDAQRHPKTIAWKDNLLLHPAVVESTIGGLRELFYDFIRRREGYATRFM
nr:glutathione S-transferase domain-containing protein [Duganella guangzhouensis]